MGIPGHLTCLLRNLYAGQKATVKTLYGTTDWLKIEKRVRQGCLLSHCLFLIYMLSASREMPGWNKDRREKHQQPQISRWSHSNGRKWRGTEEPPDKGEGGEWKSQFKTINKTKIVASDPITAWQIEGEMVEVETDFPFLGSQITADGDCSLEIRRQLLLGGKVMTNLDSVLKSRDITLPTKVCIKAMVFPVVTLVLRAGP